MKALAFLIIVVCTAKLAQSALDGTTVLDSHNNASRLPFYLIAATVLAPVIMASAPVIAVIFAILYALLLFINIMPIITQWNVHTFRMLGESMKSWSFSKVPNRIFDYYEIKDRVCQQRAVCEMTNMVVDQYPVVAAVVRSVTGFFSGTSKRGYFRGVVAGVSGLGCDAVFLTCKQSPLARIMGNRSS